MTTIIKFEKNNMFEKKLSFFLYCIVPLSVVILFVKNVLTEPRKSSLRTSSAEKILFRNSSYLHVTVLALITTFPCIINLLAIKIKYLHFDKVFYNLLPSSMQPIFLILNIIFILLLLVSPLWVLRLYLNHRRSFNSIIESIRLYEDTEVYRELTEILQDIKQQMEVKDSIELLILQSDKATELRCSGCCVEKVRDKIYVLMDEIMYTNICNNIIPVEELRPVFCHEIAHIINKDYKIPIFFKFVMDKKFLITICIITSILFAFMALMSQFPDTMKINLISSLKLFIIMSLLLGCLFGGTVITLSAIYQRCEIYADKLSLKFIPKNLYINSLLRMATHSRDYSKPLHFSFLTSKGWAMDINETSGKQLKQYLLHSYLFFFGKKILVHPALFKRIELLEEKDETTYRNKLTLIDERALFSFFGTFCTVIAIILVALQILSNKDVMGIAKAIRFSSFFIFTYFAALPLKEKSSVYMLTKEHYAKLRYYAWIISFHANTSYMILYFLKRRQLVETIAVSAFVIFIGAAVTVMLLIVFIIAEVALTENITNKWIRS